MVNRSGESLPHIARFGDGETLVAAPEALERCLAVVAETSVPELWLIPSSPAKQLGSLTMRVFGIKPRPAIVVHAGPDGAIVTFRDRHGGDYRVVNRDFNGEATKCSLTLHDGRRVPNRADEVFALEPALGFVRDFFREGDRPWRLSVRPVVL